MQAQALDFITVAEVIPVTRASLILLQMLKANQSFSFEYRSCWIKQQTLGLLSLQYFAFQYDEGFLRFAASADNTLPLGEH